MIRFILIYGVCLSILCGCSNDTIKNKAIYQKNHEVKNLVNRSQWDEAINEVKAMNHLFEKNKWKYQFMGDSEEYLGVEEEITKLQTSIDEKDSLEAKLSIGRIEQYIETLYFK